MKLLLVFFVAAFCGIANAQVPTHLVTLSGDSILYNNSKFKFVEYIDARSDTTKLGLLKENYNSSNHQLINFPSELNQYLPAFINSVVDYSNTPQEVCVVIKSLSLNEEPLGAIEIAKSNVELHFYLIKNKQYRLIKVINKTHEQPNSEVTKALSAEIESTIRLAFHEFLSQPGSEGESNQWLTKAELLKLEVPIKRVGVLPIGALEYTGLRYSLNNQNISRKEALGLLRAADDDEINELIDKNRKNFWASASLALVASTLVIYPVTDYVQNQDEFKGNYIMFGTGASIISLLAAKGYRDRMREAVDLYNERYNE